MKAAQSSWQRLASRTNGLITPGNIVTVSGVLLTLTGLWFLYTDVFWAAFLCVGFGRMFDLLDGHLARLTKTTGLFGEFIDAAADKLTIGVATVIVILQHMVPLFLIVPVFVVQVAVVIVAFIARGSHVTLHSSRTGKYSTFVLWSALLLYVMSMWLIDAGKTDVRDVVYVAANFLMTAALLGGMAALAGYLKPLLTTLLGRDKG